MIIYLFCVDFLTQKVLYRFLESLGYTIATIKTPEEVSTVPLHGLILADQTMLTPKQRASLHGAPIPVYLLKNLEHTLPFEEAMACNVYGYLRKPLSLVELELLLARCPFA